MEHNIFTNGKRSSEKVDHHSLPDTQEPKLSAESLPPPDADRFGPLPSSGHVLFIRTLSDTDNLDIGDVLCEAHRLRLPIVSPALACIHLTNLIEAKSLRGDRVCAYYVVAYEDDPWPMSRLDAMLEHLQSEDIHVWRADVRGGPGVTPAPSSMCVTWFSH